MDERASRRARVAAVLSASDDAHNTQRKIALLKKAVVAVTRRKLDVDAQNAALRAELQHAQAEAATARAMCDTLRNELAHIQQQQQQQRHNNGSSRPFGQQVLKGITSLVTASEAVTSPSQARNNNNNSSSSGGGVAAAAAAASPTTAAAAAAAAASPSRRTAAATAAARGTRRVTASPSPLRLPAPALASDDVARIVAENEALHMRIFSAQSECEEARRAHDAAEERHHNEVAALQYEVRTLREALAKVTAAHTQLQTRTRQLDALVAFCRCSLALTVHVVAAAAAPTTSLSSSPSTSSEHAPVVMAHVALVTPPTAYAVSDSDAHARDDVTSSAVAAVDGGKGNGAVATPQEHVTAATTTTEATAALYAALRRLLDTTAVVLRTLRRACVADDVVCVTVDELHALRDRLQQLCDAHDDQHVRIVSLLDAIHEQTRREQQQQQQGRDEQADAPRDEDGSHHDAMHDCTRASAGADVQCITTLHDELLDACCAWLALWLTNAPLLARALVVLCVAAAAATTTTTTTMAARHAALTRLRRQLAAVTTAHGETRAPRSDEDVCNSGADEDDDGSSEDDEDARCAQGATRQLTRCMHNALDGLAGVMMAVQLLAQRARAHACEATTRHAPVSSSSSFLLPSSSWWLLLLQQLWLDGCVAMPALRRHMAVLARALVAVAHACAPPPPPPPRMTRDEEEQPERPQQHADDNNNNTNKDDGQQKRMLYHAVLHDMLLQLADALGAVAMATLPLSSTAYAHDGDGDAAHVCPCCHTASVYAATRCAFCGNDTKGNDDNTDMMTTMVMTTPPRAAAAAAVVKTATTVVDTAMLQSLLDALAQADRTAAWYCARLHDEVAAHAAARDAASVADAQLREAQAQLAEQVADAERSRLALQEQLALLSEQIVSQRM